MISLSLIDQLNAIPSGERSDFVNEALEDSLSRYGRRKAFEELESFKKNHPLKMTTEQILTTIHDGRKNLL